MLNTPSPFPQVGSWALLETLGELQAARVVEAPADGMAKVSLPARPSASGSVGIEMDRLQDATPLTAAEHDEHAVLVAEIELTKTPPKASLDRANELAERHHRARTLAEILARLERNRALSTRAIREAAQVWAAAIAGEGRAAA
ncbi:MAG: hypothetical protein ACXW27_08685 [Allosphingosinicella sp.]